MELSLVIFFYNGVKMSYPSIDLAIKFAFSWHTEKFFLASLVLLILFIFFSSLAGSLIAGASFYSLFITIIGIATYLKMSFRQEPVYPDDLQMVTQLGFFREVIGTVRPLCVRSYFNDRCWTSFYLSIIS